MTEPIDEITIVRLKEQLENELINYKRVSRELRVIENTINHLRQMICDICRHNWTIDSSSYNEHTEFVCNNCGLTK
jgi:hypothetical protein